MKSGPFWKLLVLNYIGITLVVFTIFDLALGADRNHAFGATGLITRLPVAIVLTFLMRLYIRRTVKT